MKPIISNLTLLTLFHCEPFLRSGLILHRQPSHSMALSRIAHKCSKILNKKFWIRIITLTMRLKKSKKSVEQQIFTWNISFMNGQAAEFPPGISDGPYLAPSSPPDTPEPT